MNNNEKVEKVRALLMQFWDKEKTLSSICGLEIDDYVYLVDEIAIAVAPELYPDEPKID